MTSPWDFHDALKRSGWNVGEVGVSLEDGSPAWLVSGHNGENLIRAEGRTALQAWRLAYDQADAVGMVGRRAGG